ncbi:MAG: succinate dehydrogenase/fumarate reductase flavoprotein subunit, partial [Bradyrhizobium sp.]
FGARAGRGAAAFARANPKPGAGAAKAGEAAQERLRELFGRDGGNDTVSGLRKAMNDTMESGAGIYRSEDTLRETCGILADLRTRYRKMQLQDRSNVFNTDLIQTLELGCMLDVASALAHSALERKESRGSHQRLEYPGRDDANYLKHSLASYHGAEPSSISYLDVVITKSQPAERVYGGAAT